MTLTIPIKLPPRLEQISQALLENSSVSVTDKYGNIVFVTRAFCKQCGYSEEELIGKNHSILKSSNHPESFYSFMWNTISSGNSWKGEICNISKRGENYWLEHEIIPIFDDDNNPEYYMAISKDITQQKSLIRKLKNRAQQQGLIAILGQLSINSANIRMFIEQTLAAVNGALDMKSGMIFELNADTSQAGLYTAIGLNSGPDRMTPVPLDNNNLLAYAFQQDFAVISKDISRDTRFTLPEFLSPGQQQSAICLCIGNKKHPNGIMLLLSDTHKDITMEDAHFAQSTCNLISEAMVRHKIESELISEKELNQKYLDVADIIIVVLDEHGDITLANQKASALLGIDQQDLVGLNWFNYFVPFAEREKVRGDFGKFLRNESVETENPEQAYLSRIITKQANTRLMKWNNAVIHDESSHTLSLLCAGEDITDITQTRKEKEQLQENLFEAQKMEALGILAGGIAHDFNNILASILGYTDLALDKFANDNKKLAGYLKQIKKSGIKARDIIAQIQNYSRPGQTGLKPTLLPSLVRDSLKMLRSAIPASLSFEQHLDAEVPAVILNPARMNQLIMKLIINARNATDSRGRLSISLNELQHCDNTCASCGEKFSGHFVQLVVADSGPGIDLSRLAEMFTSDVHTHLEAGTRVTGMADIHQIVHESNGHILVDSETNSGTVFRILFKVADANQPSIQDLAKERQSLTVGTVNAHIMVVDDENTVAGFLGELLNQSGFTTHVFTDPTRALNAFMEDPQAYDLVITDQTMPLLSGDELAQKIIQQQADIPVILCTGYSDVVDEKKATAMNIKGFLKKPVEIHELLECVYRLLNERSSN